MFRPLERFIKIGEDRGADGYIASHPCRDQTFIDGKNGHAPKGE